MEESFNVAIGSVLGDGFLHKLTKTSKASLYVSQHNSKLSYLNWLHAKLNLSFDVNPIRPKTGYKQHYFLTKSNKELGILKSKFYLSRKKIIPSDIKDMIRDPISIAVWYMDDGTLDKRSKYHLNSMIATYCFTFDECQILKELLKENFNITVSVTRCNMRGKIYPRLYVLSESMNRFISLVEPFIQPVFNYKIGR